MVDKYISISTDETRALKVQTETCIQVNYEPQYNVIYSKFNLKVSQKKFSTQISILST